MSDLRLANLKDLERRYINADGTAPARHVLEKFYAGKPLTARKEGERVEFTLDNLLRHHSENDIDDGETWLRDAFDQLLSGYSILEVACMLDIVPEPLPTQVASSALLFLSQPSLRRYYETHYPLLLPQLFRWRLEGFNMIYETQDHVSASIFMKFLDLHDSMEKDPEVETFLWFLDGGARYDEKLDEMVDLDDVLAAMRRESTFVEAMSTKPTKSASLTLAMLGMQTFFVFSQRLEELLEAAKRYPLLQSAVWFLYEYWFGHLKSEIGGQLARAVKRMEKWTTAAVPSESELSGIPADERSDPWEHPKTWLRGKKSRAEAPDEKPGWNTEKCRTVSETFATLRRLASDDFRRPLEEVAADCKEMSLGSSTPKDKSKRRSRQ